MPDSGSSAQRSLIADRILALGPQPLTQHPSFRRALENYVATGSLRGSLQRQLGSAIQQLEQLQIDQMSDDQVRTLIGSGLNRLVALVLRDARSREAVQSFVDVDELPVRGSPAQQEAYARNQVAGLIGAQLGDAADNPHMRVALDAYQEAVRRGKDVNDEDFIRGFLQATVRRQFPHLTEAETKRAVAEYAAVMQAQNRSGIFGVPEGCMIPLAFVALFLIMGGVMGLLLLLLVGDTVLASAFWQTDVGRSLSATLFLMAIIGGLFAWFRRQTGLGGHLIRITLMMAFAIALGLAGVQFFLIDPDSLDTTLVGKGTNEAITGALFGMSIVTGIVMWVRRRVMSVVWFAIFGVLVAVIVLLATQSGVIDLQSIDLNNLLGRGTQEISGLQ